MSAELPTSVVQPLSSQLHGEKDLLSRELADRSFDVGDDDDLDLSLAFAAPPSQPEASTSSHTTTGVGTNGIDKNAPIRDDEDPDPAEEQEVDEAALIAEAEKYIDAFPEEVAEEMIEELKEIGMFKFLQKYVQEQDIALPRLLYVFGIVVPPSDEPEDPLYLLRLLKIAISRTLRNRFPLADYTTPSSVVSLIRSSRNILILTGAGISTSCGIPDFRSSSGIYARLQDSGKYPELTDPQEMFDMQIFLENPAIFYSFAHELYPVENAEGGRKSSRAHRWIRKLELENKLCRNYTQNIDTIEKLCGIERVLHAHGSFATCSCVKCKAQFPGDSIKDAIFAQTVPLCPLCTAASSLDSTSASHSDGPARKRARLNFVDQANDDDDESEHYVNPWKNAAILKPDITFFGQSLSSSFDSSLLADREQVDLLIVMGTSLQVAPVNEILSHIPHRIPQILINRDPVPHVMDKMDVFLLGDCDEVVEWLEKELERVPTDTEGAGEVRGISKNGRSEKLEEHAQQGKEDQPELALEGLDNVYFFKGANREHRWFERMREALQEEDEMMGDEEEQDDEETANARDELQGHLLEESKGKVLAEDGLTAK